MTEAYLLTSNSGKIAAANTVFSKYGIIVRLLDLDIDEIQAPTSQVIARKAALEAHARTGKPVIREDHSFYIDDLGMPGPFMAYIDKTIDVNTLLQILLLLPTRKGHFEIAAAYVDVSGVLHEFSFEVPVVFAEEARGDKRLNWERIMRFPDETRTFAEYPESERLHYWAQNYENIAKLISS